MTLAVEAPHLQPFAEFDPTDYLIRLAHEQGNAAHLAVALLIKSRGAPVHFYVGAWAAQLGIDRRTVARQLDRSPEIGYVSGRGRQGSLVCAPVDEEGFTAQPSLFDAAVRHASVENLGTTGPRPVDNPRNAERPYSGGSGRPESSPHGRASAMAAEGRYRPQGLYPSGRTRGRGDPGGSIEIVESVDSVHEQLAASMGPLFDEAFGRIDVLSLAALLASIEAFVEPFCGGSVEALELAAAVVLRGGAHCERIEVRWADGAPAGSRGGGFRWGPKLAAAPLTYGVRRTFLRSMARGWGRVIDPGLELGDRQKAQLRAALGRPR